VVFISEGVGAKKIRIERFVYGNDEGYRLLGTSDPKSVEPYTDMYRGLFLPVSQGQMKSIVDPLRVIISGGNHILFSRIRQSKDDIGRGSLENHTAIVPKDCMRDGRVTYEALDAAMAGAEKPGPSIKGDLSPLEVEPQSLNLDEYVKGLGKHLNRETMNNIVEIYQKDPKKRIILWVPHSTSQERTRMSYMFSVLFDLKLRAMPMSVFSDVPYPDAAELFNLIITQKDPGIKPTRSWAMLVYDPMRPMDVGDKENVKAALDDIFG